MVDFTAGSEGRGVPRNIEAERSIIGALILHGSAVSEVIQILKAEDFYHPPHQIVYQAILDSYEQNSHTDLISVEELLVRQSQLDEVGGREVLLDLAGSVVTAAAVTYHAEIVRDKAVLRRLLETCLDMARRAYENTVTPAELVDEAERRIFEIARIKTAADSMTITELIHQTFDRIEKMRDRKGRLTGVPSGYFDLDEMTSGLQPGELVIVAARPSMGKTSFALNLTERAAVEGHGVAMFSLEMSSQQIIQNMLCSRAQLNSQDLRRGMVTNEQLAHLQEMASTLYEAPIYVDDTAGLTVSTLRAKCRRMAQKNNIKMVVVDYLQLLTTGGRVESRQQEIATISRTLKGVARELSVPVIALSQLNRDVENRDNNRPRMSDLRESGALEQDADVIMLLHRDEYYKPTEENRGLAQIILAKQRNGPTGEVTLRFFRQFMRFENYHRQPEPVA
ncbi:MAG: replicative DNA helicase [Planctomycetota bacterium]